MGVLKEIFSRKIPKGDGHGDGLIVGPREEPTATLSSQPTLWDEDEHPRGQPDNAGEFAEKSNKQSEPTHPPIDRTKPHFLGSKENPHSFFVLPGQGRKGVDRGPDREIYEVSHDYMTEVNKHMASEIWTHVHAALDTVQELADAGDEPEKMRDSIDDAMYDAMSDAEESIDRWAELYHKNTKRIHNDDANMVEHKLDEAVKEAKKKIKDALYDDDGAPVQMAYDMADEDNDYPWDADELSHAAKYAREQVTEAIGTLQEEFDEHRSQLNSAVEERDEKREEDPGTYTDNMNDAYEGDGTSDDALEDAAYYNQQLAEAKNPYRIYYHDDSDSWGFDWAEDLEDYPGKEDEKPAATLATRAEVREPIRLVRTAFLATNRSTVIDDVIANLPPPE